MSTTNCIASIDQGTSSTRVLIINSLGEVLGSHQIEISQHYPHPGWVEHDPIQIWETVKLCLSKSYEQISNLDVKVVGIGITNQRETSVIWNRETGEPYCNAIVWNDTRTFNICEDLISIFGKDSFREKTGLPITTYFSASKIMYLLETIKNLRQDIENGLALFGTIDTWLIWNLTNGKVHATDVTNASRTMLMNLSSLQWDEDILRELDIPIQLLPKICSSASSHAFGTVDFSEQSNFHFLGDSVVVVEQNKYDNTATTIEMTTNKSDLQYLIKYNGVPISGVLGDQQAALFGQLCFNCGDAKCTYGTGAFLLKNTGFAFLQMYYGNIYLYSIFVLKVNNN
jgi:glycerol kinase